MRPVYLSLIAEVDWHFLRYSFFGSVIIDPDAPKKRGHLPTATLYTLMPNFIFNEQAS